MTAPTVTILAGSSYTAGTVLTGTQLFSAGDPQGSSDINFIKRVDATTTNSAVWRYNGSIITPGGAASGGFQFEYADRGLLTYTVGTGGLIDKDLYRVCRTGVRSYLCNADRTSYTHDAVPIRGYDASGNKVTSVADATNVSKSDPLDALFACGTLPAISCRTTGLREPCLVAFG